MGDCGGGVVEHQSSVSNKYLNEKCVCMNESTFHTFHYPAIC